MISTQYKKAYSEVYEIIRCFPIEYINKIPRDEISYYRKNRDMDYNFTLDSNLSLENQKISREAYAILIDIYMNYFADDKEKKEIKEILDLNLKKNECVKKVNYENNIHSKDIFDNNKKTTTSNNENINIKNEETKNELPANVSTFSKIFGYLKNLLSKFLRT